MTGITRKQFLSMAGALALGGMASAVLGAEKGAGKPRSPNILLIVTDQERAAATLPEPVAFPNRERLRRQSLNFSNYHVTTSPCSPSRSVIYTGQHLMQTGVVENSDVLPTAGLDPEMPTLGSYFKRLGYDTVYRGKWHLSDQPKSDSSPAALAHYGFDSYQTFGDHSGFEGKTGRDIDPLTTREATDWLRRRGRAAEVRPWLMAVNLINPHDIMNHDTGSHQARTRLDRKAFVVPAPDTALYQHDWGAELPVSFHKFKPDQRLPAHSNWVALCNGQFGEIAPEDTASWHSFQNHYFNCLMDVDQHIGRVLDALDNSGMADETIVVFTSDHGEHGGAHRMRSKESTMFREAMNVPLMIRVPGRTAGQETEALASAVDLLPTLLALAGVDRQQQAALYPALKGRDLTPLLDQPRRPGPRAEQGLLFTYSTLHAVDSEFAHKMFRLKNSSGLAQTWRLLCKSPRLPSLDNPIFYRGLHDGRYKFARYFSPLQHHRPENFAELAARNQLELYDTRADPHELHNLARGPAANRELIVAMNDKLNRLSDLEVGVDDGRHMPGMIRWWRGENDSD